MFTVCISVQQEFGIQTCLLFYLWFDMTPVKYATIMMRHTTRTRKFVVL